MKDKEYRKLEHCDCRYNIAHYEDVIFCPKHNTFGDIANDIARDVRELVKKVYLKSKEIKEL